MRTLTSTLTAAQKAMGDVLCKLVLTSGATTKTYGVDTTNRILHVSHPEEEWSQTAQVLVDNRDGNLTALSLEGYTGTISYGYATSAGDEYSACAPLECISQKTDTDLLSGDLVTSFGLAGRFNLMAYDNASAPYTPEDTNTDTIKTILTAVIESTMSCFSHCKAYTATFDSEDTLIDSYYPADYFRVGFNESRLSVIKRLLSFTKCKARIEDDGEVHIFDPTITGSTYDYEYNDAVTYHNFFDKSTRKRLVIPNKIVVSSHEDHEDQYTGNATDADSYAALGRYLTDHYWRRVTGNAQCTAIATAILQHAQVAAEKGHGHAPMNVGQEVMDYINITDSVASDTRAGNIGYLHRTYQPGKFDFEFRFGTLSQPGLAGTMSPSSVRADRVAGVSLADALAHIDILYSYIERLVATANWQTDHIINLLTWIDILAFREQVPKWHVYKQMIIPVWV